MDPKGIVLTVGDIAPAFKPFRWIKGEPVSRFEGGHVYVVEFGATWCRPCLAAIPDLSAVSRKFAGQVTVISAFVMEHIDDRADRDNPPYVSRVERFVSKRIDEIDYRVVVDDPAKTLERRWLLASGRNGIPQTFVIGKDGRIAWIGSNPKMLREVVTRVLNGEHISNDHASGAEPAVVASTPFGGLREWLSSQGPDALYVSSLSQYQTGQTGERSFPYVDNFFWTDSTSRLFERRGRVIAPGHSLRVLYAMAYGDTLWNYPVSRNIVSWTFPDTLKNPHRRRTYAKYWYRPLLEMEDSSEFITRRFYPENRFNYFLQLPREGATASRLQKAMRQDLDRYFGYRVEVESRLMPCWYLKASKKVRSALKSREVDGKYEMLEDGEGNAIFRNAEVRDLIFQLEIRYGYSGNGYLTHVPGRQPPFVDATEITGNIDYTYPAEFATKLRNEVDGGPPFTFEDYKAMLEHIGFQLIKGKKQMKVIVIRDKSR